MFDGRAQVGAGPYAFVVASVVDQQDVDTLRRGLNGARSQRDGDLYVQCGALNYACLDALRVFVGVADQLAQAGRALVLVGLSPYFRQVFRVTEWDRLPGLAFADAGAGARAAPGTVAEAPSPNDQRAT
ncbi:MAG: STAS domain-containing protein [Catenulispora sp.]